MSILNWFRQMLSPETHRPCHDCPYKSAPECQPLQAQQPPLETLVEQQATEYERGYGKVFRD